MTLGRRGREWPPAPVGNPRSRPAAFKAPFCYSDKARHRSLKKPVGTKKAFYVRRMMRIQPFFFSQNWSRLAVVCQICFALRALGNIEG